MKRNKITRIIVVIFQIRTLIMENKVAILRKLKKKSIYLMPLHHQILTVRNLHLGILTPIITVIIIIIRTVITMVLLLQLMALIKIVTINLKI